MIGSLDSKIPSGPLEKKWENFGTDASRKRFTELLDKEPDLKAEYEKQKK